MFKIALVGNTEGNNNHTSTFNNAIEYCINYLNIYNLNDIISLEVFNDYASYKGGREVAKEVLSKRINYVIGHFSSDSIAGAYSLYEKNSIDVILPAATNFNIRHLRNIYRICPNKEKLQIKLNKFFFELSIEDKATERFNEYITFNSDHNFIIYSGRIENLDQNFKNFNKYSSFSKLITFDDCIHPHLNKYLNEFEEIYTSSFSYKNRLDNNYPTYYYEFISGFELAISSCLNKSKILNNIVYNTTNLDIKFLNNENVFSDYSIDRFLGL